MVDRNLPEVWDDEADLVVEGSGGGGLTGAVVAAAADLGEWTATVRVGSQSAWRVDDVRAHRRPEGGARRRRRMTG